MTMPLGSHDYKEEMKDTLERSDNREHTMFSPPIFIASQNRSDGSFSTSGLSLPAYRGEYTVYSLSLPAYRGEYTVHVQPPCHRLLKMNYI